MARWPRRSRTGATSVGGRARGMAAALLAVALLAAACATSDASKTGDTGSRIVAVGAENEYGNVISQIGGPYVSVTSIMSNPNTDPHTFESSPSVAEVVSSAQLVVQNGLGYDTFMNRIEAASPDPARRVIDVQDLLHLPSDTPNPHLWYKPTTMPAVARAIATDLSSLDPAHRSYFMDELERFDQSLVPWDQAIAALKADFPGTPVAVTEPVADYMLAAAGADIRTPWVLQADIMNGVDPPPQDVTAEQQLFSRHQVKVFLYNQQVTDSLTASFLATAKQDGIPVVGVYETMPTPGYDYQSWMMAEVHALRDAIVYHVSTQRL